MSASKPDLLVLHVLSAAHLAQLTERFTVRYAPTSAQRAASIAEHGAQFRAVLTVGAVGLTATEMDAMPQLTWIGS